MSHPSQPRAASPRGDVVQDDLRGVLEAESNGFATFDDDPSGLLGLTGADGPRSEGGRRILLDNSRVYVRFLPFVSDRVHLGRLNMYSSILGSPLEPRETTNPRPTYM